jgi:hypothetical protein
VDDPVCTSNSALAGALRSATALSSAAGASLRLPDHQSADPNDMNIQIGAEELHPDRARPQSEQGRQQLADVLELTRAY